MRPTRLLLSVAVSVALLQDPAAAHAELEDAIPAPCSAVESASEITLSFSAELDVGASSIEILQESKPIARGGVDLSDLERRRMTAILPADLNGLIDVRWQTASATDKDTESGGYQIAIGATAESPACEIYSEAGSNATLLLLAGATIGLLSIIVLSRRRLMNSGAKSAP